MRKILVATSAQKLLDFLTQNPGKEYLAKEIQKATKISKAGTNFSLRDLVRAGTVKRQKRGKVFLYTIGFNHPVIKQSKVLGTVISLYPLIKKLVSEAKKVILYGSASRGENTKDSDIDLFVVTNSSEKIKGIVGANKVGKKIQLTMRTPLKYVEMEKAEPTFYREVERGIILWETRDES